MRKFNFLLLSLLLLSLQSIFAQTEITGKVKDVYGNPIPGATVSVNGGSATTTGSDGSYSLKLPSGKKTIVVSNVGFVAKIVTVAGITADVVLELDNKALSEVVVTGTGVAVSKRKVAIAVEAVNVSNQVKVPTGDVGQQLVGQIAGAQISSTNGSPGSPLNILLRGINTVQGNTFPMILMDGIEVKATDLNSLDVNIIDRVEVIQGAAAASLYGAQGANGVIQLFTKRAKAGKINIDISSGATSNELLNIGGVSKSRYHAFVTNANNEVIDGSGAPLLFDPITGDYSANVQYSALSATSYANKAYDKNLQYYDHYKMFFQKGYVLNNSITISGNRDKTDFLFSVSSNKQNSNFKRNGDYQRNNLTSNLGIELFKNFKFRTTTQLVYTKNTLNDQTGRGIVYSLNNTRPFANYDYIDPDGNYGNYVGDGAGVNGENPNYVNQYSSTLINKVDVVQNFNLNYKVNRFVELDAKYGLNFQQQNTIYRYENQQFNQNAVNQQFYIGNYNPNSTPDGSSTGEIDNNNNRTVFQNFIATATIRTDFEKDFHIRIPIKTSTQLAFDYRKNSFKEFYAYGYDAPNYSPWNATQAGVYKVVSDYTEPFITYGTLVNQRFEYGDIGGVSVGFRSDYSSAFGSGAKAQTFPRGDAYLNISKFNFWQDLGVAKVLSDIKFRGAYGEAGIQPTPFQRFPVLGAANLGTNSQFTFPLTNPNPLLQVEISKETEVGVDLGFKLLKNDWLRNGSFSLTYWDRKTDNAIYKVDAAPSTGVGSGDNNAFGLASHGIQASLNLNILSKQNLNWDFTTNFSKQTSKISKVTGAEVVVTSDAGSSNYVLRAGDKIGQLFGYLILRSVDQVDPNTGQPFIAKTDQANYEVASNGWVVNKTTKRPANSPGKYAFGDPNPKFNMSFMNNFTFKGFLSFSMQWDWVYGSHLYNQTKSWMYRDGISSDYAKPITITNPTTGVAETQAFTAFYRGIYQAGANNGTKDYFYENASFLRLRNISVAVDFAKLFKIPAAFQRVQLVLSGRNLITKTKYTGMDPEVSSGSSNSTFDRGVDHNTIPNTKAYSVGLNIGF